MDTWDFGTSGDYPLLQCPPGGIEAQLPYSYTDSDGDGSGNNRDVDDDGDGLIEIRTANELNDIRRVLDGSGYQAGSDGTKDTTGCPTDGGCKGYELTANIDLTAYGRGYDGGKGWAPIGSASRPFNATLDGNGFAIRNLYINRREAGILDGTGFFGNVCNADIHSIALQDIDVMGDGRLTGGLIGAVGGGVTITASSVTGTLSYSGGISAFGGLFIGVFLLSQPQCQSTGIIITSSYTQGTVISIASGGGGGGFIGGLSQNNIARITSSYTATRVMGTNPSTGFIGTNLGTPTLITSYWDSDVSGIGGGQSRTTVELQSPTSATGIYATWNQFCPNDGTLPVWNFGTDKQYPRIQCRLAEIQP